MGNIKVFKVSDLESGKVELPERGSGAYKKIRDHVNEILKKPEEGTTLWEIVIWVQENLKVKSIQQANNYVHAAMQRDERFKVFKHKKDPDDAQERGRWIIVRIG